MGFALRPSDAGMTWPSGNTKMLEHSRAHYDKLLLDAAEQFNGVLELEADPVTDADAYLKKLEKTAPDRWIIVAEELHQWQLVNKVVANRGEIPMIVYSNGTGFIPNRHLGLGNNHSKPSRNNQRFLSSMAL